VLETAVKRWASGKSSPATNPCVAARVIFGVVLGAALRSSYRVSTGCACALHYMNDIPQLVGDDAQAFDMVCVTRSPGSSTTSHLRAVCLSKIDAGLKRELYFDKSSFHALLPCVAA
jgi:hypothetical protein